MTDRPDPQCLRVLLTENIHPDAVGIFGAAGHEVETIKHSPSEDELCERITTVDVLGSRSKTQVTKRVLENASSLVAIGAFCIGTNQIDSPVAAQQGIAVFNAPFSNTRSVVELAVAEIIAMTRRLTEKNRRMHEGIWDKSASGSHEIRGRRLGIVGYGNIGTQLSVLAESLGMTVYFYDTEDKLALGNARRCATLEELLGTVDVVTLHVDGRPGNSGMFGVHEFARMRKGSLFLNLSRGFVVDYEALRSHIAEGRIAGAAVDVFPEEPNNGQPFDSVLRGLPNVILTPHVGGSTEEAQQDIARFVAGKLTAYLANGSTSLAVNLPNLSLPGGPEAKRLAHVHHNVPGVLAAINRVLAEHSVNVDGQHLGTQGDVGYVITDINSEYTPEMVTQLRDLPATIRLRVLS